MPRNCHLRLLDALVDDAISLRRRQYYTISDLSWTIEPYIIARSSKSISSSISQPLVVPEYCMKYLHRSLNLSGNSGTSITLLIKW